MSQTKQANGLVNIPSCLLSIPRQSGHADRHIEPRTYPLFPGKMGHWTGRQTEKRVNRQPDHITCRLLPHTEGQWISRPHYLPSVATHRGTVDIQTTLPAVYCQTLRVNRQTDHITCRLLPNIEGQTDGHKHHITCRLLSYIVGQ